MKKQLCIEYSLSEIDELCTNLLPLIDQDRTLIGLEGGLGAGKTTFIRAFCKVLGLESEITSPSYTLENQYSMNDKTGSLLIRHWDLYRLSCFDEVLEDILEFSQGDTSVKEIILVEWHEKCPLLLENLDYIFQFSQCLTLDKTENLREFCLYSREMPLNEAVKNSFCSKKI